MTVTFCGHSDAPYTDSFRNHIKETIETLIDRGAREFLLGGYGAFDNMVAGVVRELKKKYPNITAVLVLPYLNRTAGFAGYDTTVYPPLETVPKRFAISHRNRWMVENSDIVVAYVNYGWGGAATTLRYAAAQKRK